jgi:hypothetical protein
MKHYHQIVGKLSVLNGFYSYADVLLANIKVINILLQMLKHLHAFHRKYHNLIFGHHLILSYISTRKIKRPLLNTAKA